MPFLSKLNNSFQRNQNIKAKLRSLAWQSQDHSLGYSPEATLEGSVSGPVHGPRAKGRCQGHKEILLLCPIPSPPALLFNTMFTFHLCSPMG